MTGNGLSTVPKKAELTPEPGFKKEVQDISGCQMRCVKIKYPNVSVVWSRLYGKIS